MVHWQVEAREIGIVITCRGHDKDGTVGKATEAFGALIEVRKGPCLVIADLSEMTGYETSSRHAWQDIFRRHRRQMRRLVLVGARSKIIRVGAAMVGAVAGVPVTFVDTWSEVGGVEE
jgi:hypothetical protein